VCDCIALLYIFCIGWVSNVVKILRLPHVENTKKVVKGCTAANEVLPCILLWMSAPCTCSFLPKCCIFCISIFKAKWLSILSSSYLQYRLRRVVDVQVSLKIEELKIPERSATKKDMCRQTNFKFPRLLNATYCDNV
jgi:hypothetical protein